MSEKAAGVSYVVRQSLEESAENTSVRLRHVYMVCLLVPYVIDYRYTYCDFWTHVFYTTSRFSFIVSASFVCGKNVFFLFLYAVLKGTYDRQSCHGLSLFYFFIS